MHVVTQEVEGMTRWISTGEALPEHGRHVLAFYRNALGKPRIIIASHLERWTEESYGDEEVEDDEYHEERDAYYLREGWYEQIDNWDTFCGVTVSQGEVTHWMPLPEVPA